LPIPDTDITNFTGTAVSPRVCSTSRISRLSSDPLPEGFAETAAIGSVPISARTAR
jgi:hypothetical protein